MVEQSKSESQAVERLLDDNNGDHESVLQDGMVDTLSSIEPEDARAESYTQRLLFTSHFLSTWNSRLFEFGAFLFLASLFPATLLPASVYALTRAAAAAIVAPWLGNLIDRTNRLRVVRLSIAGQRIPVMLTCVVFAAMLQSEQFRDSRAGFVIALLVLSALACIEKLSIVANTISVERDWVVVIAGGNEVILTKLNSRMRRIDLFCKLVAPLAISLVDAYSTMVAIFVTGALSAFSCLLEYLAIARVYHAVPALAKKDHTAAQTEIPKATKIWQTFLTSIETYCTSAAFLPSMALSVLYFTSLSFAGQLITYLLAPPQSTSPLVLSIIRGLAACAELSATFMAPKLISRIGSLRAGSWFLNIELGFIILAGGALWLPAAMTNPARLALLITAVIFSRIGLWGFDLAVQQQVQDSVTEVNRGSFSSIEAGLQNVFEMLSFLTTIIWAKPDQFKYSGTMSVVAVTVAAILYAAYVRQHRGHLLHLDQALCGSMYWQNHFGKRFDQQAGLQELRSTHQQLDDEDCSG